MSDQSDDENHNNLAKALKRYKPGGREAAETPVKVDKRTETSKANMAKARAAKLEQLRAQKERKAREIEVSEEEDSEEEEEEEEEESDDGEEYVIAKRKPAAKKPQKGKGGAAAPPAAAPSDPRIDELAALVAQLVNKKSVKRKAPVRKTVINVQQPAAAAAASTPNPKAADMRQHVNSWWS